MMDTIKYPIKIGQVFKLSLSEEVGNMISHGVLAVFFLCMLPLISVLGYIRAGMGFSVGLSIYGIGIFFYVSDVYAVSCHAI